jgi:type IV conjugative transfer system protein TraL
MNYENHVILNHLDSPLKILLWNKSEILGYVAPFVIGICCSQTILGFCVSLLNFYCYKKAKTGIFEYFYGAIYWNMPNIALFKGCPPSFIKMYVG